VPAAGQQPAEDRALGGLVIEVEGLGIELAGEGEDLVPSHRASRRLADIPRRKVLEIEHATSGGSRHQ
jgi:hypothetical protein